MLQQLKLRGRRSSAMQVDAFAELLLLFGEYLAGHLHHVRLLDVR